MKTKSLSGISALIVALLVVGAIFVPAVGATTSENAQGGTADEITLDQVDRKFLDCYGWLTKEPSWIRYGGWATCSYPAAHLSVTVYLRNWNTGEEMGYTSYSGANLDYIEAQDNLEVQPPPGKYYTYTRTWSAGPSDETFHESSEIFWP